MEGQDVDAILKRMEFSAFAEAIAPMGAILGRVYSDGAKEAMIQIGIENQDHLTDLLNERASLFAENRAAELVGMTNVGTKENPDWMPNPDAKWQITESTREYLRADVAQAIEEGWSTDHLAEQLKENYAFSDARAEMISRTEIARADVEGNMAAYRQSGVVMGKQSVLGSEHDEDDICTENADAGVIPLDAAFPSGDDAPPYHPRCVCDVIPVLMDEEGEE